jgi:hypothetical protein
MARPDPRGPGRKMTGVLVGGGIVEVSPDAT